jgi:hypothetical protein
MTGIRFSLCSYILEIWQMGSNVVRQTVYADGVPPTTGWRDDL